MLSIGSTRVRIQASWDWGCLVKPRGPKDLATRYLHIGLRIVGV